MYIIIHKNIAVKLVKYVVSRYNFFPLILPKGGRGWQRVIFAGFFLRAPYSDQEVFLRIIFYFRLYLLFSTVSSVPKL